MRRGEVYDARLDPTGAHHLFYVAVTQAEVIIQSDATTDDLAWKTVIFVAVGGRGRGMSGYLLGCSAGFEKIITGVIMSRVRKDAQQLDNASQGNHQERIDTRGITDHGLFVPEECTRAVDQHIVVKARGKHEHLPGVHGTNDVEIGV